MRLALVLVCFTFVLVGSLAEQCGKQAGDALCPGGLCCSQYGYCGSTTEYCDEGCQSQCGGSGGGSGELGLVGSLAEQCGKQAGDALCPGGLCCSQYGYCGSTPDYCGEGCQSQCGGSSGGGGDHGLVGSLAEQCGKQAGDALCPGGLCCSQYGYCGSSSEYCGEGCQSQCGGSGGGGGDLGLVGSLAEQCGKQAGDALCPGGLCCSQYGYCGSTPDYCGDGCQSQCGGSGGGGGGDLGLVRSLAEQCGKQAGDALCPGGLCCSQYGYCGSTSEYCGEGCQSQCGISGGGGGDLKLVGSLAEQCGKQAGDAMCPGGLCCSQYGYCGSTAEYCGEGCQSQCVRRSGGGGDDLGSIISRDTFNQMLKHRNNGACPANGFYTYDAFITAAKAFPNFGNTGDTSTKKREIAAFFGQTSHETTGGWPSAPDGPYAWGYCFVKKQNPTTYCVSSTNFPCTPGKQYYGRGPIQISWNYNYGQCGRAIGVDLLNNPDLVAIDPVISFKSAIWFWMTPQSRKPSCHDVITGRWSPSSRDQAAGRLLGYGMVTNIINGGLECGRGEDSRVQDRIGFYKRYCDLLGIGYGDNLDCAAQRPFGSSLLLLDTI